LLLQCCQIPEIYALTNLLCQKQRGLSSFGLGEDLCNGKECAGFDGSINIPHSGVKKQKPKKLPELRRSIAAMTEGREAEM